jgi:hypothetical protein
MYTSVEGRPMPGPVFLQGDGIDLRTIEEADLEFLQESVNDPSIWRAIGRVDPVNRSQEQAFFENVVCENGSVAHDGTPVKIGQGSNTRQS